MNDFIGQANFYIVASNSKMNEETVVMKILARTDREAPKGRANERKPSWR